MCVASSKKIFHIVSSVVRKICLSCLSRPRCRRGLWESKNGIPFPLPRSFPCFELDRVARKTSHLFLRGDGARRRRKKKIESRVNFAGGPSASSLLRQERARSLSLTQSEGNNATTVAFSFFLIQSRGERAPNVLRSIKVGTQVAEGGGVYQ